MNALAPTSLAAAIEALSAHDADLARRGIVRRSLAPTRAHATSLAAMAAELFRRQPPRDAEAPGALVTALARIAEAVARNFPENIFWDLDYLAACMWRGAHDASEGVAAALEASSALVVELNELFGCHTDIRFRYTHDFLYGYDWAKWVARDPHPRTAFGPFDPTFLVALRARAGELLELIALDDAKYGRLQGTAPRNPFGFSREPEDEALLHADLAARGLLPIEAWKLDAEPDWERPFLQLREERARALGLSARA